jgi:hypothetical protein
MHSGHSPSVVCGRSSADQGRAGSAAPARRWCAITVTTRSVCSARFCPVRGVGGAIIMPAIQHRSDERHLNEISTRAGWHQPGGRLRLPDNITILPLPSSAPDLNKPPWKMSGATCFQTSSAGSSGTATGQSSRLARMDGTSSSTFVRQRNGSSWTHVNEAIVASQRDSRWSARAGMIRPRASCEGPDRVVFSRMGHDLASGQALR